MGWGRWFLSLLGAAALSGSPSCGGKTRASGVAEETRPGNDGTASTGASRSSTTSTASGVGGASSTNSVSSGGSGGDGLPTFLEACDDEDFLVACGVDSYGPGQLTRTGCEFHLTNVGSRQQPAVLVDCVVVDRFRGEGGAAGQGVDEERWDWDPGDAILWFYEPWCTSLLAAATRIDFIYPCQSTR